MKAFKKQLKLQGKETIRRITSSESKAIRGGIFLPFSFTTLTVPRAPFLNPVRVPLDIEDNSIDHAPVL